MAGKASKSATASGKAGGKKRLSRAQRLHKSGGQDHPILMKNKHGRIVSKSRSKKGSKSAWMQAVKLARSQLGIKGFQVVGGDTETGQMLYARARKIYDAPHH